MNQPTKAVFDKPIRFLDQRDWIVYEGQRAHLFGASFYGLIPLELDPKRVVRTIGMDYIVLRDEDDAEQEYRIKDAPQHWRQRGIERLRGQGVDYEALPDGDIDLEPPIYDGEEYEQEERDDC